jgi:hypothetical protein
VAKPENASGSARLWSGVCSCWRSHLRGAGGAVDPGVAAAGHKARLLLNPRDIDIHLLKGNSCTNWSSQHSYAVGLGSLITTSLNTFSTFMVHDKTNYNINEPSSSGKTLTIEFVNQRHYRAAVLYVGPAGG